jgi:hypothetical protein
MGKQAKVKPLPYSNKSQNSDVETALRIHIAELENIKDNLSATVQRQAAQIENLKSEVYKLRLLQSGASGGVKEIIEQANRDRQEFSRQLSELQTELRRVIIGQTPYEAITAPIQGNADDSNIPPDLISINLDKSCVVAYRIAIRYGAKPEDFIVLKGKATFPGSLEEAIEELPLLVDSAVARSPTMQEITMGGLINARLETLWKAMFELSMCYGDEFAAEKYEEMFNRLFHEKILPEECPGNPRPAEIADAREKFVKAVNSSFANLRENGRGTTKQGKLKRGPKSGNVTGSISTQNET